MPLSTYYTLPYSPYRTPYSVILTAQHGSRILSATKFRDDRKVKLWALLLFLIMGIVFPSIATAASLTEQRTQFITAVDAFKKGDQAKFLSLEKQLKNYILSPYLRYMDLTQNIKTANPEDVQRFINTYPDSHMAEKLYSQWLHILAQRKEWSEFLAEYKAEADSSKNIGLNCLYRTALLNTGNEKTAFANLAPVWKTGKSLPTDCDALFLAWKKTGSLTTELVWQRILLVATTTSADASLMKQLAVMLPPSQQALVTPWSNILQIAKKEPDLALKKWYGALNQYSFTSLQKGSFVRALGLSFATSGDPRAAEWLAKVPSIAVDQQVREWRIRIAIAQNQWKQVRSAIKALPEKERAESAWRYWLARSDQQLDENASEVTKTYQSLAQKPDYYGFLASARLQQPFVYKHPGKASSQEVANIANRGGFKRAYEFQQIKWITPARQEWQAAIRELNTQQLRAAGQLALKWQWYDRAIVTAAKAGLTDDINLRFPIAFRANVITEAERYDIDPSWVFAIMRQESAFIPDAMSSAGAMGLMQVMPATAKWLAQKTKETMGHPSEILRVEKNISLGTRYLSYMLETNQGNIVLATAAYNGGPNRIKRWLPIRTGLTADQWIESLPWHETRNYVKKVLTYTSIYDLHFGEQPNLDIVLEKIS
jgi:soluble lytic murein transglycosylase